MLNRSTTYQKPRPTRALISYVLGNGLTSLEGAQHARQKRIIAPTFSNDNLMALLPIFFGKACELKDRWNGVLGEIPEGTKLDVCSWSSRATIDVIGLAGICASVPCSVCNTYDTLQHLTTHSTPFNQRRMRSISPSETCSKSRFHAGRISKMSFLFTSLGFEQFL